MVKKLIKREQTILNRIIHKIKSRIYTISDISKKKQEKIQKGYHSVGDDLVLR